MNVEIKPSKGKWIKGRVTAGGTVRVPFEGRIDHEATYTLEFEEGGRLFRWMDQKPKSFEITEWGSFAVFTLPESEPVNNTGQPK